MAGQMTGAYYTPPRTYGIAVGTGGFLSNPPWMKGSENMIELGSKTEQVSTYEGGTRWAFYTINESSGRPYEINWEWSERARDQWLADNSKKYAVLFMTHRLRRLINTILPLIGEEMNDITHVEPQAMAVAEPVLRRSLHRLCNQDGLRASLRNY